MASKLKIRRSQTNGIASAGTLEFGELVFTEVDGKFYVTDHTGTAKQVGLVINGNTGQFLQGDGSWATVSQTLDGLTDVTITSVASGEILKWDGSAWINQTLLEAGIQAHSTVLDNTTASFTTADETKLDGIEAGAQVNVPTNLAWDQTTSKVTSDTGTDATLTNATGTYAGLMSSADYTKLGGIEAGADVTDSANVAAAGAVMYADTSLATASFFVDEDNMASNSATKVPSQQSVKAYVDTAIAGAVASEMTYKGGYNASTNTPDLDVSPSGIKVGDTYTVTAAGTFFTTAVEVGDFLIANKNDPTLETDWTIVNKNLDSVASSGTTLTAGEGLSGGGDLSANRTFAIDWTELTAFSGATDAANDVLAIYDASATGHRKIAVGDLLDGGTF